MRSQGNCSGYERPLVCKQKLRHVPAAEMLRLRETDDPWAVACEETAEDVKASNAILAALGLPSFHFRQEKHFPIHSYPVPVTVDKCKTSDYLDCYVFPYLLAGIKSLIEFVLTKRLLACRYTTFSPLDYLAEYLFNVNPRYPSRQENPVTIADAEFAKQWLAKYPRLPYPKWVTMSRVEAAAIVQRNYRGYLVRRREDVQELRQFWKNLRLDKEQKEQAKLDPLDDLEEESFDPEPVLEPFRTHSEDCELCSNFKKVVEEALAKSVSQDQDQGQHNKRDRDHRLKCDSSTNLTAADAEKSHLFKGKYASDACCFDTSAHSKEWPAQRDHAAQAAKRAAELQGPKTFRSRRLEEAERQCHSGSTATVELTIRKSKRSSQNQRLESQWPKPTVI